ncbi:MAG TPA: ImmA/IrrE family metallo-endopeptidase [bacterium]|nr:ImmA/IrrE family metallo-endopeptidase [bacterium]
MLQLESGGRPFTTEEQTAIRAMAPVVPAVRHAQEARRSNAAVQAREVLEALGAEIPVDVEAIAERLGYPVRWRAMPEGYRGGIEGDAGYRILVLNRDHPFRSDAERRWVMAEELAHAVLGHTTLAASESAAREAYMKDDSRRTSETDARSFAAELLMPAAEVRRSFASEQGTILRALGSEERVQAVKTVVADLAREFRVSQQAMRIRLAQLGLLA